MRRWSVGVILWSCLIGLGYGVLLAGTPQERPDSASGVEAVRTLLDAGRYADAERLAAMLVAEIQSKHGPESLETARVSDLLVEALIRNGKAGAAETLATAQRVVRLKERFLGRDDPALALSIDSLGAVHTERGELTAALPLHERGLAIRRRALGSDDSAIADSLDHLALPLILLQRFRDAEQRLDESLRIRDKDSDASPLARARTLYLTALLHRYDGRYAIAGQLLDQSLALRQALLPADHPAIGATFQLRGELNFLEGDVAAAQRDWSTALAIAERSLRPGHPDIALSLRCLALAAKAFGDLATARRLLDRALPIGQQSLGPCHQELPALLNDSASITAYEGDYSQTQKLYATALATRERCLGPNDQRTATVVHNQALLAAEMGDFALAERLHRRAIQMWSVGLGPNHPFVARGLDALAVVMAARQQLASALELYERALAIRRRTLSADHPDVAWTLTKIAEVTGASGNLGLALRRLSQAFEIYQRAGVGTGPGHLAESLVLRGTLEVRRGDFHAARASFGEALSMRQRIFGAAHPLVAAARADVAWADLALGFSDDALNAALDAEHIGRDQLLFTIRYLPERQAMAYADKRPRGLDLALSVISSGAVADSSTVMDAVIRSRGVVLDELAARAQAVQGADNELASLNAAVVMARERFATLMLRSLKGEDPVPTVMLAEARERKETAERALAEKSATARAEAARSNLGLPQVRPLLPEGTALVAFVRYDRTTFAATAGRKTMRVVPSYIAFVARADASGIESVPLGSASSIETAISAWRDQVGGQALAAGVSPVEAERTYRIAGARLRERIWDPLAGHIRGVSQVFIVPDGAVNLVSFAALPTQQARYLVEDGPTIHYLSTERDLVPFDSPSGQGLLAVGGPAFDERYTAPSSVAALRSSGCTTLGSVRFADLPGSRNEAGDVARIWSSIGEQGDARLLSGRTATETAVKQGAAGRRVVHLATHGYFLDSRCDSSPASTRGVGGLLSGSVPLSALGENPLLLSGLAFAGAGVRTSSQAGADDGILTAEEVAGLNLQGTEWAVLSACDTGTGQIKAGEGVFGLRRAFQIAGARTIIMSLWSVEDQSTRSWMRDLYNARFSRHLTTAAAVREASLNALEGRRARHYSTHPFYWAGFVAAGDWR